MKPDEIETLSFSIIDAEAGAHPFPPDEWSLVRRMIHTSADFDYVASVRIHPGALTAGVNAIRQGKKIITDTNMARVGIRQSDLARFHVEVRCLIAEPEVARKAKEEGSTRAKAAVDVAAPILQDGIAVVGNAPTALLRLIEKVRDGSAQPALIVGLPVGFVNAAESKEALQKLDVPYITNVGRKGGSNVAASVVNALALLALSDSAPEGTDS